MPARRADRRARIRHAMAAFAGGSLAVFLACSTEQPLQGDVYEPENTLPIAPPTVRPEGGGEGTGGCDAGDAGGPCDASVRDVIVLPPQDASNAPTNTCETARDIGTLSGDTTGPSLSTKGTCSEWVKLRATENDDGVLGAPMKLKVTLTPPPGVDLELYAFLNPNKDVVTCGSPFAASESGGAGALESLSVNWGEGSVANGSDDGRTVGVFVFHPGTPCTGTAQWNLVIDGNL